MKKLSVMLQSRSLRISLSVFIFLLMALQRQFAHKVFYWLAWGAHVVLKGTGYKILMAIKPYAPFNPANVWLWSKGLYFIIHLLLLWALVFVYFNKRSVTIMAARLMAVVFSFGVFLNVMGKLLHAKNFTDGGRTMTDMFMGPFAAAFLIPVLLLHLNSVKQAEKARAKAAKAAAKPEDAAPKA
ncbi:MAG: hypothetical protein V4543_04050 [Bacteroidota bacterium]